MRSFPHMNCLAPFVNFNYKRLVTFTQRTTTNRQQLKGDVYVNSFFNAMIISRFPDITIWLRVVKLVRVYMWLIGEVEREEEVTSSYSHYGGVFSTHRSGVPRSGPARINRSVIGLMWSWYIRETPRKQPFLTSHKSICVVISMNLRSQNFLCPAGW